MTDQSRSRWGRPRLAADGRARHRPRSISCLPRAPTQQASPLTGSAVSAATLCRDSSYSPRRAPPPPPHPAAAPMGYVVSAVARVLEQPMAWGAACEMALLTGPLWAAALIGLLLGWATGIVAPADPPQFASLDFWRAQLPARICAPLDYLTGARQQQQRRQEQEDDEASLQGGDLAKAEWSNLLLLFRLGRSSEIANEELVLGKADLVNLWRLVEGNDSGPASIRMMEKALPNMTYQACRRYPQRV
ncbi:uncharacterized protein LOC119340744 isoform X2 [Triticum dicoccoides]|uniref:uncharacterized protein LOC119340744 isoform X2 n=1 Tax=Triticum dicoccoides TaxID=85692 RepID=UPI0018911B88|nr:uncharacterized protein LOC119340744 isoform X2 [Triticum dicoccoides]